MARQLHFNLFLHDTGHHEASWRLPESDPHANLSLAAHQHLARVAEDAKFDSVFLADSPALWNSASTAASDPASAAVCELAARAPALDVPALSATIGFRRARRPATRANFCGLPNDSR